jgi:hypothetical protein
MKNARLEVAMNMEELRTNEVAENHLIGDFADHAIDEGQYALDTEQYAWIACRFDDVMYAISVSSVLFLIASVIAIAVYTVT